MASVKWLTKKYKTNPILFPHWALVHPQCGEYRNLSWNPKGNRLATASDALRIWDTKGNLISEGNSKDYLWGVSWNEQGTKIITSSMEQRIIVWNKKAKRILTIEQKGQPLTAPTKNWRFSA